MIDETSEPHFRGRRVVLLAAIISWAQNICSTLLFLVSTEYNNGILNVIGWGLMLTAMACLQMKEVAELVVFVVSVIIVSILGSIATITMYVELPQKFALPMCTPGMTDPCSDKHWNTGYRLLFAFTAILLGCITLLFPLFLFFNYLLFRYRWSTRYMVQVIKMARRWGKHVAVQTEDDIGQHEEQEKVELLAEEERPKQYPDERCI